MGFILIGLLFVTALFILRTILNGVQSRKQLPPGPKGLPVLGNILQLGAGSQIWLTFDRWKYKYGLIMYLNMVGQNIIVLNTQAAATELLEQQLAIYSDRPTNVVAEYLGSQLSMPFARYGKTFVRSPLVWQSMRRAGHAVLNAQVSALYQPVQIEEAVILAHNLLYDTSSPLLTKINWYVNANRIPFKLSDTSDHLHLTSDPLETLRNIAHRFTNAMYPGAYLVDILPILDYLPAMLAKWKRDAQKDFKQISDMFQRYFHDAMQNDPQRSSLCVRLAEDQVAEGLIDAEKAWVAGVAALETTSTTLMLFLYAIVLHPNVQEFAQLEIDRVIGRSRNPTFSDIADLPYVRAIVKEVLRWQPAIPLAVPHIVMQDDWYEGYFIPKGIPNASGKPQLSMNRGRDVYSPDPDQFRPERFLQQLKKGAVSALRQEYEVNDGHYAYGFGRRACIGRHVADNALFINICTMGPSCRT
ncbi:cytochrome P450 [Lentinula boryana]|uniref:Cytochrome P450 n=1 Tax=Lentinula boryana TaxID=40481 RepID=A0ABQ8PYJ1_9AGAR|nr:cytochrome P450 [Lentinula boryana]